MFVLPLILAAGSLSTLSYGAPVPSFLSSAVTKVTSSLSLKERSTYTVFGGTGEISDGWPSTSSWVSSLDTMFTNNLANLQGSCSQWNVANPTDDEISNMKSAINSVASSTGVDARFIFAIVMQESNGCVRAPTTNYGVRNPGLMQSHDGTGTCNDGSVQNPCPSSEITQMIQDGAGGTSAGDGLKQCIAQSGASDDSKYYKAARIYNSGSIASTKNLGAGVATHCYASDVANRLTGWTGAGSTCDSNTIGTLTGTVTSGGSSGGSSSSAAASSAAAPSSTYVAPSSAAAPAPSSTAAQNPSSIAVAPPASTAGGVFAQTSAAASTPTSTPTTFTVIPTAASTSSSAPSTAPSSTEAPVPAPTASSGTTPVSTTAEKYPYASTSCKTWYTVQPNDYCILVEQKTGVTMAQLQSLNGGLDSACSNLWLGYQYCVGA